MSGWPKQLVIGVVASVCVHVALGALLSLNRSAAQSAGTEPEMVMVDIDEAPEAAEAHTPRPDSVDEGSTDPGRAPEEAAGPGSAVANQPTPAATVDPAPPTVAEPIEPDPVRQAADASVPDAAAPDARSQAPSDPMRLASSPADAAVVTDAGVGPTVARAGKRDGGPVADAAAGPAVASAGIRDGGVRVASTGIRDGGVAPLPGATANLLAYVPKAERVAVMIRFERMRGTEWIRHTEAVLEPMPDYQLLFSQSAVKPGDAIDTLVISSSSPRDVTATTLGVKVASWPAARLRAYINRPSAPVRWSAVRGGVLGRRLKSRLALARDKRVFLMPYPGWVVLARPAYLGALLGRSSASMATSVAPIAELPQWLARIRNIEREAGLGKSGPALLLTMNGFQKTLSVPLAGKLPGPERITLALEVATKGFYVRGELRFATPAIAKTFLREIEQFKSTFVGTSVGKRVLGQVHAYNALAQLSLKQGGRTVGFSTSISISDGRLMMQLAAAQTRRVFGGGGARRVRDRPAPKMRTPTRPSRTSNPRDAGAH